MNTIFALLTNMLSSKYTKYTIAVIILALGYFYHQHQLDKQYQLGYKTAEDVTHEKYRILELDIRNKLTQLTVKHQQEVNQLQQQMAVNQSEYQKQYEKGKQDAEKQANRVIDELRNNAKRLSIETRRERTCHTGTTASTDTSSAGSAVGRTALSERSARFLIQQATQADNTLRELNLCKQTLWETRRMIQLYNQSLNK